MNLLVYDDSGTGKAKVSYISALDVAAYGVAAAMRNETGWKVLEIGGPEALSQLDAVRIFEDQLQKKLTLEFVPEDALKEQHRSSDPLQKTFAALMIGYAKGDVISESSANAARYGIPLHSVADYAATFE